METTLSPITFLGDLSMHDADELACVWEASVRTTHAFLTEEDIQFYKTLLKEKYLSQVELYVIRNSRNAIAAFMGLSETEVEMLFVHPQEQGKGYGKRLLFYALCEKHINRVDVNEQNEKAFSFYKHLGYAAIGREETDSEGRPFPILHLQYFPASRLETSRLLLRLFAESDLEDFFECCRNPNLGNNAGWKPHETLEESSDMLRTIFLNQENVWAIVEKESSRLIGSIGLIADPKRENSQARMLGYWLKESHWGKGMMKEAVQAVLKYARETLGLELVSAYCYPFNQRSQGVLQGSGFLYEGRLYRAERLHTGEVVDHLCYYFPFV